MVNDPVGDMIARMKNAATRGRSKVSTPASKMRARVLDVLAEEGYIRNLKSSSNTLTASPSSSRSSAFRSLAVASIRRSQI